MHDDKRTSSVILTEESKLLAGKWKAATLTAAFWQLLLGKNQVRQARIESQLDHKKIGNKSFPSYTDLYPLRKLIFQRLQRAQYTCSETDWMHVIIPYEPELHSLAIDPSSARSDHLLQVTEETKSIVWGKFFFPFHNGP